MLVALFTLLLLGGGGSSPLLSRIDELVDKVKAEVQAKERRAQAVEILEELQRNTEDFSENQQARVEQLSKLNEVPNLDRVEVDAVWSAFFDEVETYHDLVLSQREELKTVINRSEWTSIFAADVAK